MSLVEVMVVVALSSILLGVAMSLAVSLQQWDSRFRDHLVCSDQLAQLADSIRSDIRAAANVSLPTKDSLVISAIDQSEIRYELRPDRCERIVKRTPDSKENRSPFSIGSAAAWTIEDGTPGRRSTTIVSLMRLDAGEPAADSALIVVYAILGADSLN